jgi:two-component system chemotaxis response regulator CheY
VRALVVDDSRAIRLLLRRMLTELNHSVVEASDGKEALALLRGGERPDVALVDWNMPEMDGVALIRAVRCDPSLSAVRLMVVTTETEVGRVAEALEAGAQDYILKPLTIENLKTKLAGVGP